MRGADVDFQLEYVYLIYDKKIEIIKINYKYNSNNNNKKKNNWRQTRLCETALF